MHIHSYLFPLLLCASAFVSHVQAQEFIHIQVDDYAVVDSLPVYFHEIPLGTTGIADYAVELIYPEYVQLTAAERKFIPQLEAQQAENLEVKQLLTTSRKEKFLQVSFTPFVKRGRQWLRLSSCKIDVRPLTAAVQAKATSTTTERWQRNSVLSQGKWVKIRVAEEGIYALSPEQLKQLGFTQPQRVKVYGYGGLLQDERFDFHQVNGRSWNGDTPDDLVEQPTLRRGDEILFWAEGTRRWSYDERRGRWSHTNNHYSTHSYYFLTEGDNPLSIESLPAAQVAAKTLNTIPYGYAFDEDKANWYEGGRRMFHSYDFQQGNQRNFNLSLPDFAASPEGQPVTLEVAVGASSTQSATQAEVSVNGVKKQTLYISTISTIIESARAASGSVRVTLADGNPTIGVKTTVGNSARLDYIRTSYTRNLMVNAQPYSFTPASQQPVNLQFANHTSQTRLWQIGSKGSVTKEVLPVQTADGQMLFPIADPAQRYVAFDDKAAYPQPEFVENVEPQNLHADENIDYVILVPSNGKLDAQAERLANIHRERSGLRVKVVKPKALYNEFSSGTPDANAYRRYLKMLYDRAATPSDAPKYVLFMGKSPWDNRLITDDWKSYKPEDFLLAYEVDASTQSIGTVYSYVTDDFFGMLDDGEGGNIRMDKLDLATGRMVCNSEAEARRLVDKVELYLSNKQAGAWKNNIVLLGDDGDANEHMEDAEQVSKEIETAGGGRYNLQKIYWDRYTRQSGATGHSYPIVSERVRQLMREGAAIFNYSGHGAPHQISHERSLLMSDFQQAYSPMMALWVLASCEIFPFDSKEENLAEASLFLPEGGSIAFMCASRAVYAAQNNALNRQFSKFVMGRDAQGKRITMAEALRLAKVQMVTTNSLNASPADPTINKLKYVYFGDPALTLALPTGDVIIDHVDGQALGNERTQLSAGRVVRIGGYVTDSQDSKTIDAAFNGTLRVELFDRTETIVCKDNDGSARKAGRQPLKFKEQVRSIFKGAHIVKNGRFEFTLTIPRDISYTDDDARFSFHALSDDFQKESNGVSQRFFLNGTAEGVAPDTIAPKALLFLNDVETEQWAVVSPDPVFVAQVSDDSGINATGNSLGHDIELTLDGQSHNPIVLNDFFSYAFGSYQKGEVVYPLRNLSLGRHTLDFKVWDVNNNVSRSRLNFIVSDKAMRTNAIAATQNPAQERTTFITNFESLPQGEGTITYEVFDNQGRRVWQKAATLREGQMSHSIDFDLRSAQGVPLPAGIYLYRAIVHTAAQQSTIPSQKLIITRP